MRFGVALAWVAGMSALGSTLPVPRAPVHAVQAVNDGWIALNAEGAAIGAKADAAGAINAAIADASRAGPGGTVLLPAGVYRLDAPIQKKPGVRLVGEGGC